MSITTTLLSSSSTNKPTRTNLEQQQHIVNITNIVVNDQHTTLVIILTVILPILAFIAIITIIIIIYRRRHSKFWLTKLDNSSRLQAIVVNLSPISIQSQYSQKNLSLSHLQYQQPRTKTIVFNHINSTPATPIVYNSFKGETNAAFDECPLKNDQQPIITLEQEFPASLQAPVPLITSTFVEAIATHRLTLHSNINIPSLEASALTNTSDNSRDSGISQTVLLFSQRTEF